MVNGAKRSLSVDARKTVWPELVGTEEDCRIGWRERDQCARLLLEWTGPASLDKEVASAVRDRARALLEHETDAAYWRAGRWKQDVFGWTSKLWKGVKWEPENRVQVILEVQASQAELWGLAAWAEGYEVAEWVRTCAAMWVIELGRVADEARRGKAAGGISAVGSLWELANKLRNQGEFEVAGILMSLGLLLRAGHNRPLAKMLEKMAAGVVSERLCQHLAPEKESV